MKATVATIWLLLVIAFLAAGCSQDTPTGSGSAVMSVTASCEALGIGSKVSGVGLQVSGDNFDEISKTAELINGEATLEIEVPFGASRLFEMWAYDMDSVVLYRGDTTADVVASEPTFVTVNLEPQVTMLRAAPLFSQVASGSQDTVAIEIHDIDSLYGAAFRIHYDPDKLLIEFREREPLWVIPGDFFDPSEAIFFHHIVADSDFVAITYVLRGDIPGAVGSSGSGVLAYIVYQGLESGRSPLNFREIEGEAPMLIDRYGRRLPLDGDLYVESGEVEVLFEQ
jgi:hypothetical protein